MKQESLFYWYTTFDRPDEYHIEYHREDGREGEMVCSAFTVAELGEMCSKFNFFTTCTVGRWKVELKKTGVLRFNVAMPQTFYADTEADARGAILVYLLENGCTVYNGLSE